MFHLRPRLRFNGCYISTVNYIRPGGNTASQVSFNTPVHIVTYYRYLRFFRDGTCASLLTTSEPSDVVHYLTKENMHTHHAGGLPSAVMNNALRGRWKLSGDPYHVQDLSPEKQDKSKEGNLHIETEGADAGHPNPKYIYKLALQLMNVRKGTGATRNNKLAWMGYWSYNTLTADWAEFGLKNDKAFIWSRVRSYGGGE
jgi:F-box protein 9